MGLGLLIGFIEYLQITSVSNITNSHSLCSSLEHALNLLGLLCLQQLIPGDASQQCLLDPFSRCSYQLATFPQLTNCSNCPAYNISTWIMQKTQFLCCIHIFWDAYVIAILSHCLATSVVYRAIIQQRLLYCCLLQGCCLAMGLLTTTFATIISATVLRIVLLCLPHRILKKAF